MQIIRQDDWLKAARITGPTHHYLGIRFGIESLNDSRPVASVVLDSVAQANTDFGTSYQVSEIQLADGDKYNPSVYQMMAYQMVRYAAEHELVFQSKRQAA